jgi:hypothetical protein
VPLTRSFADVGLVVRVGEPGRLSLFGGSLSREESNPSSDIVIVTDTGIVPVPGTSLDERYSSARAARLNFLWGVRNVGFKRVEGFDALTGEQDVRTGFQLAVLLGRSLSVLGTHDDEIYRLGYQHRVWRPRALDAIQLLGAGRQSYDSNRWDDILTSGRAAWYFSQAPANHDREQRVERRVAPTRTVPAHAWRACWGLRGYSASELPGGQRLIFRLEERWVFSNVHGTADAGAALLGEAGRLWAGDVPFGETIPMKYAVGTSFLVAFPPALGALAARSHDAAGPKHRRTPGASTAYGEQHSNLLARAARRRAEPRTVVAAAHFPVAVAAA